MGPGLLMKHNRQTESLHIKTQLDTGMTAMVKVNIESETEAAGEWLVEEAVHDLKNNKTSMTLYRCRNGIR